MRILIIIISFTLSVNLYATIINIPDEQQTIQEGINIAVNNDTILVSPGTYVENINYNGKNIAVGSLFITTQDTSYISQTVINGNQNGSVVTFESGEDSTAVLIGFLVQNGLDEDGGGIKCINSSPKITNNMINANYSDHYGGGVYLNNSTSILRKNVIEENSAAYRGGGIYSIDSNLQLYENIIISNTAATSGGGVTCNNCSIIISENIFNSNYATFGGGLSATYSTLDLHTNNFNYNNSYRGGALDLDYYSYANLTNNTILNNEADFGGGISTNLNSEAILIGNTISNNIANNRGGGICSQYTFLDMSYNIVNNNEVTGSTQYPDNNYGGGIYMNYVYDLNFQNNIIALNEANQGGGIYFSVLDAISICNNIVCNNLSYAGGGIYWEEIGSQNEILVNNLICNNEAEIGGGIYFDPFSESYVINNTISNNLSNQGGGIYFEPGCTTQLINSILVNNYANSGHQVFLEGVNADPLFSYCNIQEGVEGFEGSGSGANFNSSNYQNCIEVDPIFTNPCNGYGTEFSYFNYDWTLQQSSLCIDAGIPDTIGLGIPIFDLNGSPRLSGSRIDMGCYEWQNTEIENNNLTLNEINLDNYPNPFNPSTTIKYYIQNISKIDLTIFNIKGQKIKILIKNELLKGHHSIIWNGDDENNKPVSSGVYLYRLNVNNKTIATNKCLLLK